MPEPPTLGLHYGIPQSVYRAWPGINQSGLKQIAQAPSLYKHRRDHPQPSTPAQLVGLVTHTLVLEPNRFADLYAIRPGAARNKAGKEALADFRNTLGGKTEITPACYGVARDCAQAVRAHPVAKRLLAQPGHAEVSLLWRDSGLGTLCKARLDWLCDNGVILELKKTRTAAPGSFPAEIARYGHHVQAAFYLDGIEHLTGERVGEGRADCLIIAVEPEPPYLVAAYLLDDAALEVGRRAYRAALRTYFDCDANNEWPGYGEDVTVLELPRWAMTTPTTGSNDDDRGDADDLGF